jgi:hypothetical protein
VALLDRNGSVIATATQPAGLGGGILAKMSYPDKIYFNPRYKLVLWPEGRKIDGSCWNVAGTKGWAYEFSFTGLSRDELARLHSARATIFSPLLMEVPFDQIAASEGWGRVEEELRDLDRSRLLQSGPLAGMSTPAAGGAGAPGAGGPGMGPMMGPGEPGMGGPPGMPGGPGPGGPGMPPPP